MGTQDERGTTARGAVGPAKPDRGGRPVRTEAAPPLLIASDDDVQRFVHVEFGVDLGEEAHGVLEVGDVEVGGPKEDDPVFALSGVAADLAAEAVGVEGGPVPVVAEDPGTDVGEGRAAEDRAAAAGIGILLGENEDDAVEVDGDGFIAEGGGRGGRSVRGAAGGETGGDDEEGWSFVGGGSHGGLSVAEC